MKLTKLEQLHLDDEVILTIKAKIKLLAFGDGYVWADFSRGSEYISVDQDALDSGVVILERVKQPLPSRNGVYVPRSNMDSHYSSWLYIYDSGDETDPWSIYTGSGVIHGAKAVEEAEEANNALGGLVSLKVGEE